MRTSAYHVSMTAGCTEHGVAPWVGPPKSALRSHRVGGGRRAATVVFLRSTWRNCVENSTPAASRASFARYALQSLYTQPASLSASASVDAIRYVTSLYPVAAQVAPSAAVRLRLSGGRRLYDRPCWWLAHHVRHLPICLQSSCPSQRLRDLELLRNVPAPPTIDLIGRLASKR